jgi:hypothetical protein
MWYILLENNNKFIIIRKETSSLKFDEKEYPRYDINELEEEFKKLNKL